MKQHFWLAENVVPKGRVLDTQILRCGTTEQNWLRICWQERRCTRPRFKAGCDVYNQSEWKKLARACSGPSGISLLHQLITCYFLPGLFCTHRINLFCVHCMQAVCSKCYRSGRDRLSFYLLVFNHLPYMHKCIWVGLSYRVISII